MNSEGEGLTGVFFLCGMVYFVFVFPVPLA